MRISPQPGDLYESLESPRITLRVLHIHGSRVTCKVITSTEYEDLVRSQLTLEVKHLREAYRLSKKMQSKLYKAMSLESEE